MIIKTNTSNKCIKICIPTTIKMFNNSKITLNKTLEGFIIKKATIDDYKIINFPNNNSLYLSSLNNDRHGNIEGDYTIEIEDQETLKLIKI